MADTTAPVPPSPIWDLLKTATPYIGQLLILLATFGTGMVTQHVLQKPGSLPAADRSAPTPLVSVGDVDHIVKERCDTVGAQLQLILERLPAKKPGR